MTGSMERTAVPGWLRRFFVKFLIFLPCLVFQAGCAHFPLFWHRNVDPALQARISQQLGQAQASADSGDLATAEILLIRACEMHPRMVESQIQLGKIRNLRQNWAEAIEAWNQATKLDPDDPSGWSGLAEAETALGEFDKAMKHLKTAIDLSPHRAEPHVKLGELHEARGEPQEALQAYMNCLNVENDNATALMRVARIQRERGQFTQAVVRLDRVLDLTPDNAQAHLERGLAHRDQGQHQLAARDFRRAMELAPDRLEIKLELALLLERTDRKQEAKELVRDVLERSPELVGAKELDERLQR
jgi:tetratricopeptide (TPR) repeat protein